MAADPNRNENEKAVIKLKVIAAADENMGIGKNNLLPWHLPNEFKYFLNMTTNPKPDKEGNERKNVIIIGRKTWQSMDQLTSKPFPNSINIVLTRNEQLQEEVAKYKNTVLCKTLKEAIQVIQDNIKQIDEVWVLGGAEVYKSTIESDYFDRLYLTKVHHKYECDSYFPESLNPAVNKDFKLLNYEQINDNRVLKGIQTDEKSGVQFEINVYEKS